MDEDLKHFNKRFDDWCAQFDTFEDASIVMNTLEKSSSVDIVEITPLSYPQYFFPSLQGIVHTTRKLDGKIICIVEPYMGASFRIAVCDLATGAVRLTNTKYKSVLNVEGAFANFSLA